jgi:TIR domain
VAEGDGSDPIKGAQTPASEARSASIPACAVFISYAFQDAAVAAELCEGLEREGVACWIALHNVKQGYVYGDTVIQAINNR